jgi:hypothetical protein
VYRIGPATAPEQLAAPTAALPLPNKPSIAVLPFANMSGDPEQEYFADGMVEEIITALSRIRWLFVIARNSSFTYKGQAIDVKQVGRELGQNGFATDSPVEGDGFEPVWGFSCQVVFLVCCRFFVRSGKAVLRPVACDQVRGARGRRQGTETVAKLGGLPPSGACVWQRLDA